MSAVVHIPQVALEHDLRLHMEHAIVSLALG